MEIEHSLEQEAKILQDLSCDLSPEDFLELLTKRYGQKVVLVTGFGASGVVLIDMLAKRKLDLNIISLDTGRLPEETYALIEDIRTRYLVNISLQFPDRTEVESLLVKQGPLSFKKSVELRKECCKIRKVLPLERSLKPYYVWISGVRKDQSQTRSTAQKVEIDYKRRKMLKCNPLVNWTEEKIWQYIKEHQVPYNQLYDQQYSSIGCAPCTRPIQKGETIRDGRWWWEDPLKKECGIHGYCELPLTQKNKQ